MEHTFSSDRTHNVWVYFGAWSPKYNIVYNVGCDLQHCNKIIKHRLCFMDENWWPSDPNLRIDGVEN